MKAVAAMYLFQPHRAARDFHGIRAEFDKNIFQPDHNVIPYHLACYANYKFEFFIRNNRIDRSAKIFKYYILFALGFQYCGEINIFSIKKAKQNAACEKIRSLLVDESGFVTYCDNIAKKLGDSVSDKRSGSPITPREKLRDTLRTETFASEFRERLQRE